MAIRWGGNPGGGQLQRWLSEGRKPAGPTAFQQKILKQLQNAQARANQANLNRYQTALATQRAAAERMRAQFGTARESMAQVGRAAMEDVNIGAQRSGAQQQQRLIGSGLAGTTITSAVSRGVEADRRRAMGRVEEQRAAGMAGISQQQAGYEMQAGGALTGLMAGRQDVGPDLGMFASLLQQGGQQPQRRVVSLGARGGSSGGGGVPARNRVAQQTGAIASRSGLTRKKRGAGLYGMAGSQQEPRYLGFGG